MSTDPVKKLGIPDEEIQLRHLGKTIDPILCSAESKEKEEARSMELKDVVCGKRYGSRLRS
jgi:hypothetical protein